MELVKKFIDKVDVDEESGCWIPRNVPEPTGYVKLRMNNIVDYAHRWAFRLFRGPLVPGLSVHHKCYTPRCCNPAHLEQITHTENIMDDSSSWTARVNRDKTHCKHGHEFTPDNTNWVGPEKKGRQCRTCMKRIRAKYEAKRKALRHAAKAA